MFHEDAPSGQQYVLSGILTSNLQAKVYRLSTSNRNNYGGGWEREREREREREISTTSK